LHFFSVGVLTGIIEHPTNAVNAFPRARLSFCGKKLNICVTPAFLVFAALRGIAFLRNSIVFLRHPCYLPKHNHVAHFQKSRRLGLKPSARRSFD
jgi:hypothetical protein